METPSVIDSSNATQDDLKAKCGRIASGRPSHIVLICVVCMRSCFMSMPRRNKILFTFDCRGKTQVPDRSTRNSRTPSRHHAGVVHRGVHNGSSREYKPLTNMVSNNGNRKGPNRSVAAEILGDGKPTVFDKSPKFSTNVGSRRLQLECSASNNVYHTLQLQ